MFWCKYFCRFTWVQFEYRTFTRKYCYFYNVFQHWNYVEMNINKNESENYNIWHLHTFTTYSRHILRHIKSQQLTESVSKMSKTTCMLTANHYLLNAENKSLKQPHVVLLTYLLSAAEAKVVDTMNKTKTNIIFTKSMAVSMPLKAKPTAE